MKVNLFNWFVVHFRKDVTPSGSSDEDPDNPAVANRSSNYSHEPGRQFRQTVNSLYSAESMNKEKGNEEEVDCV